MTARARLGGAIGTLLLAAAVLLGGTAAPVAAQAPETGPTLSVNPRMAAPGAEVRVRGEGWPARRLVMVEVCGNNALLGSPDCVQSTARTISTTIDGRLSGTLTVPTPPQPCPCVVRAFIPTETTAATVPFEVIGHPTAPVHEPDGPAPPALAVRATLDEVDGLGALFGAAPERVLHLEVENVSDEAVDLPRVVATFGRDAGGDGYIEVPAIESVAPGETVELDLPFELPVLAMGSYVVSGQVIGVDGTAFAIDSRSVPWGLVLIPAVLLLHFGAVRLRRRVRRRAATAPVVVVDEAPVHELDDLDAELAALVEELSPPRPTSAEDAAAGLAMAYRIDLRGIPIADDVDGVDGDRDHGGELVGAGAGRAPRRRRTYAGLCLAMLASIGLWSARAPEGEAPPLAPEEVCATLEELDVVQSLAGTDLQPKAVAVEQLALLSDRVPVELRPALAVIAAIVESRPGIEGVSDLDPGNSEAWNAAALAVYGLDLDDPYVEAATRIEKYAVEECGMERSGRFDLSISYAITLPGFELDIPEPGRPDLSVAVADVQAAARESIHEAPSANLDVGGARGEVQIQEAPRVTVDVDAARGDVQITEPPAVSFDLDELHERFG